MTVQIIQDRLNTYSCANIQEEEQALREITQEVILAGLARTDFFKHAAFHGGTSLRIFHGTGRFSEDLDFVLMTPNPGFTLEDYLPIACRELSSYGFKFEMIDRSKADRMVKKAFVKDDSIGKLLEFDFIKVNRSMKKVKVKIEVDANPPSGAGSLTRYLTFPFPASVTVHDVESLFAGKLHALLCREYIKGRDWYDFLWYISRKAGVNYSLLRSQINQTGPWQGENVEVSGKWCHEQLLEKVKKIDWDAAKRDVEPFVRNHERPSLKIWSVDFFSSLIESRWGKE
jgi:predicted nucleotidyltransferase component of viral defense system